jgi:tripartite-type tricarboxylate transporter receptor subunit TctC
MSKITRRSLVAAGLATPFVARHGFAQSDWPKGPVRWVVAFAAGGAADTVARNIAVRASEILNQQVIIENRTGGNAVVAANFVLQAPRDGQTFLIDAANQVTNPYLIKDLPFDYPATWIPVTLMSSFPQVVAVKQDFPAQTIQEYIAAAKAKPGTVSYGTPPAAGMGQMAGEELQRRAGIKLIHAPYRGGADAARDIGAGAIDSVIITRSGRRSPPAAPACWP